MTTDPVALQKRVAGRAAVAEVESGMVIGLGTGSTAAFTIEALGERVRAGLAVAAVATSEHTAAAARAAGIALIDLPPSGTIDLCIDGVDEIDPLLRAIKGAGGAMLREKIVGAAAARMIAVADGSKQVIQLGRGPVPVETLPFARTSVSREIARLGGRAHCRIDKAGAAARTDQGNLILDCAFGAIADPATLAAALSAIPGALGHGLFLGEIDILYIATETGLVKHVRPAPLGDGSSPATHP